MYSVNHVDLRYGLVPPHIRWHDIEEKTEVVNKRFYLLAQVSKEDGVLVFAEGEVASAFGRMLLGDGGKAELLGEIVTKEEERVVAEVLG